MSGVPTDQVQPYLLGNMVKFSSVLRISKRDGLVFISDVTALLEFEQRRLDYLDKNVLSLQTITIYLTNGEQQIHTRLIYAISGHCYLRLNWNAG
ncbi:MAG: aminoglycoside phosphotransferase [Glaciecola sp.]